MRRDREKFNEYENVYYDLPQYDLPKKDSYLSIQDGLESGGEYLSLNRNVKRVDFEQTTTKGGPDTEGEKSNSWIENKYVSIKQKPLNELTEPEVNKI